MCRRHHSISLQRATSDQRLSIKCAPTLRQIWEKIKFSQILLLFPITYFIITTYPLCLPRRSLGEAGWLTFFFNPNAHLRPIMGRFYVPVWYEIKCRVWNKTVSRSVSFPRRRESSRFYFHQHLPITNT